MNAKTQNIILGAVLGPPTLYGIYVLCIIFSRPTTLLPVSTGSPAIAYTAELSDHRNGRWVPPCDAKRPGISKAEQMDCYRKIQSRLWTAPDGSAFLSLKKAPYTLLLEGCHELWIESKLMKSRRVIKLSEGDPGSGTSFSFSWSADSKAVFVYGATAGINCRATGYKEFAAVYSLADDKIWEVVPK